MKKTRGQNSSKNNTVLANYFGKKDPSTPKHCCGIRCTGLACDCGCKNCDLARKEREKIDKSVFSQKLSQEEAPQLIPASMGETPNVWENAK
jgi:hypothetical protein